MKPFWAYKTDEKTPNTRVLVVNTWDAYAVVVLPSGYLDFTNVGNLKFLEFYKEGEDASIHS